MIIQLLDINNLIIINLPLSLSRRGGEGERLRPAKILFKGYPTSRNLSFMNQLSQVSLKQFSNSLGSHFGFFINSLALFLSLPSLFLFLFRLSATALATAIFPALFTFPWVPEKFSTAFCVASAGSALIAEEKSVDSADVTLCSL